MDALSLEKQNLEKRFEASTKEAKGNWSDVSFVWYSYCNFYQIFNCFYTLSESFDQIKRDLLEEKEYEARLRK